MPINDPFGIGTPVTTGRMTWFNPRPWSYTDPNTDINWTDTGAQRLREGPHASGLPIETPGFATAGQGGLGGWHEVTLPGGKKYVTQKTDIGPPGVVDLNAALASQAYPGGPRSVPGGQVSARYLGPTLPSGMAPGEVTDRASGSPAGLPELQYALPGGTDAPPGSDYPPEGAMAGGGKRMPDQAPSLLDMFKPSGGYYGPGGERTQDLMSALPRNMMILGGLGYMNQRPGTNTAMQGFQQGMNLDADIAARNMSLQERRAERTQAQANTDRAFGLQMKQFERGGEGEFTKLAREAGLTPGSPEFIDMAKKHLASKLLTDPGTLSVHEDDEGRQYSLNNKTGVKTYLDALPFGQGGGVGYTSGGLGPSAGGAGGPGGVSPSTFAATGPSAPGATAGLPTAGPRMRPITGASGIVYQPPANLSKDAHKAWATHVATLEAKIAGGELTNDQALSSMYAGQMENAENMIKGFEKEGLSLKGKGLERAGGAGVITNMFQTPEYQHYQTAKDAFINNKLRRQSGATIRDEEYYREERIYFPQPGDDERRIEQKRLLRQDAIKRMKQAAGPSYFAPPPAPDFNRPPPSAAGAPSIGGSEIPPPPSGFQIVR